MKRCVDRIGSSGARTVGFLQDGKIRPKLTTHRAVLANTQAPYQTTRSREPAVSPELHSESRWALRPRSGFAGVDHELAHGLLSGPCQPGHGELARRGRFKLNSLALPPSVRSWCEVLPGSGSLH
jgi:hypothetical protein